MKRLVITGPRQASFDDVDIPECPPDGLLVRANVTAVSTGTEIRVYRYIPVDEDGEWLHMPTPERWTSSIAAKHLPCAEQYFVASPT